MLPTIVNMTVSGKLDAPVSFDHPKLSKYYNPTKFSGAIIPCGGSVCILLFSTGSWVCLGSKSHSEARKAVTKLSKDIGRVVTASDVKNVVASVRLGFFVNLEKLFEQTSSSQMEVELFSGLVIKHRGSPVNNFAPIFSEILASGELSFDLTC